MPVLSKIMMREGEVNTWTHIRCLKMCGGGGGQKRAMAVKNWVVVVKNPRVTPAHHYGA